MNGKFRKIQVFCFDGSMDILSFETPCSRTLRVRPTYLVMHINKMLTYLDGDDSWDALF
jgi:hypothetical protein